LVIGLCMEEIKIKFPDGSTKEYAKGISPLEIARSISANLAGRVVAARINGRMLDLTSPLESDSELLLLTFDDPEGREVFWHSSSHIMAQAVTDLFPTAKLAIGPPIEEGWYYDFDVDRPFSEEDLARIEKRMAEIVRSDLPFSREEWLRQEAIEHYRK